MICAKNMAFTIVKYNKGDCTLNPYEIRDALIRKEFIPIDDSPSTAKSAGFIGWNDETPIMEYDCVIAAQYRIDERKVNSKKLRLETDAKEAVLLKELQEANPDQEKVFVSRARKKEIKEQCHLTLLTKTVPTPNFCDVFIDTNEEHILIGSTSEKIIDEITVTLVYLLGIDCFRDSTDIYYDIRDTFPTPEVGDKIIAKQFNNNIIPEIIWGQYLLLLWYMIENTNAEFNIKYDLKPSSNIKLMTGVAKLSKNSEDSAHEDIKYILHQDNILKNNGNTTVVTFGFDIREILHGYMELTNYKQIKFKHDYDVPKTIKEENDVIEYIEYTKHIVKFYEKLLIQLRLLRFSPGWKETVKDLFEWLVMAAPECERNEVK